ncbi:MAG TPA: glycosyltransferase family 2 protein [Actinomycetota bacterium]|nr:glycosyltransferase family 2 protein [Actinomycetota bacterium]
MSSPLVSVVMVTYGGKQWIRPAIEALAANTEAPYELIIVDNASDDETVSLLREVSQESPAVTVLFNQANVGFGPGANQGVLHARAPYVCILNSDAFVGPGWLPPLIEALELDPSAGAAVPRLLHLDGHLQEAGGVVGRDGSTRAVGDGDDPEALPYRFRRYVDYGSAACLVMRRSVFNEVGGFDPAYPMGYCEDVDLCFALHERGLRTVYEPRSSVRHVRWGSSSRIEAERRVFANQPILLARWQERLAGRPSFAEPPFEPYDVLQARDAEATDRIVVVSDSAWGWPSPPSGRTRELARAIVQAWPGCRVTFLVGSGHAGSAQVGALLRAGVEVAAETDWDTWFEGRRYHYSMALVSGPAAFERFDPLIAASQPQATRVYDTTGVSPTWAAALTSWWPSLASGPTARLAERLASLERWAMSTADIVLCATEAGLADAARATAAPAFLVPDPAPRVTAGTGVLVAGALPPGPRFGGLDPGARALSGPVRTILDALPGPLRATARTPPGGDAARLAPWLPPGEQGRVWLLPPPLTGGGAAAALASGIPVVTWAGGAAGLDLGGLESRLVATDAPGAARLLEDLLEDPGLWDETHRQLLARAHPLDRGGERMALWAALAPGGFGRPEAVLPGPPR